MATRGGGRSQATPEMIRRLAELHELIIRAEDEVASLKQEYAGGGENQGKRLDPEGESGNPEIVRKRAARNLLLGWGA